jgi:hypothetical protein
MNTMTIMESETHFQPVGTANLAGRQAVTAVQPTLLARAIQAAADTIADGALKPLSLDAASPFAQARAVLALLAHCYAQQIYSSEAVAALASHDADFPWPWCEALPDAGALRRFRIENRGALHRCLTAALRCLMEEKISAGALTRINGLQLAEEAGRRIVMAAFVDSMELDGE